MEQVIFSGPNRKAVRPCAADSIIIKNNKILLIKRNKEPFKGMFAIPGGFVELNETVEQACVREAKEETGLDTKIKKLVGIFSDPKRDEMRQVITIVYEMEIIGGNAKAGDDASEFKWFDLNNLPSLAFDHKEIISRYLGRKN